jgi:hypothetical protein
MRLLLDVDRLQQLFEDVSGDVVALIRAPLWGISRIFSLDAANFDAGGVISDLTNGSGKVTRHSPLWQEGPARAADNSSEPVRHVALCIVGQLRSASSPDADIPAAINRNIIQAIAQGSNDAVHLFFVLGERPHDAHIECGGSSSSRGAWACSNDDFIRQFPRHLMRGVRAVNTSTEHCWSYGDEADCPLGYGHSRHISPQYTSTHPQPPHCFSVSNFPMTQVHRLGALRRDDTSCRAAAAGEVQLGGAVEA